VADGSPNSPKAAHDCAYSRVHDTENHSPVIVDFDVVVLADVDMDVDGISNQKGRNTLPKISNHYCLTGQAGGSPNGLGHVHCNSNIPIP
jgi:hypothetical protein